MPSAAPVLDPASDLLDPAPDTALDSPHPAFEATDALGGIRAFRHRATGLSVLVMEQPGSPVATFMVTYRVGSRNEGLGLTGATHFLEHLMFKGTDRFNAEAGTSVFQALQSLGAQVNATTWLDRTNYFAVLPAEHLALAVEIEADRMRGARLSAGSRREREDGHPQRTRPRRQRPVPAPLPPRLGRAPTSPTRTATRPSAGARTWRR